MNAYDAVAIAEGFSGQDESEENQIAAWQYIVDHGLCSVLQGSFGRTAARLIDAGIINPPS